MNFASDNTSGAHPAILDAVVRASRGPAPSYGEDELTARATALLRETLAAPDAAVFLVATGTAANSLALAALARPFDAIFCTADAHIHTDECNAPEFFTGGAKLVPVPAEAAKMAPHGLAAALAAEENRGVHGPRRGPVSIASLTERGTHYDAAETAALAAVCRDHGVNLHLDGARLANAVAALDTTPAALTWQAGVAALSFGGTKNGCLGVEAVVFFEPETAWEFARRRKRAGHLFSKHRFLAAQMVAYLESGLWLDCARHANAMGRRLLAGLRQISGARVGAGMAANLVFAGLPRGLHRAARAAGADYHIWDRPDDQPGDGPEDEILDARFVCSWNTTEAEVDRLLDVLKSG